MTKLEELARSIGQTYDIPRFDQERNLREKIETALKPLLDAVEKHMTFPTLESEIELGEQLSQWRKK